MNDGGFDWHRLTAAPAPEPAPEAGRGTAVGRLDSPATRWLAIIVLVPGMILGALFPLASRLLPQSEQESGTAAGRVYGWNTAGSTLSVCQQSASRATRRKRRSSTCGSTSGAGLTAMPIGPRGGSSPGSTPLAVTTGTTRQAPSMGIARGPSA